MTRSTCSPRAPAGCVPLAEAGDPVFAAEMVGPGVAIDPTRGPVTVVSPDRRDWS